MQSAYARSSAPEPFRRRLKAIGLTGAVHLLLFLLLLKLAPDDVWRRQPEQQPNSFELTPDIAPPPKRTPAVRKTRSRGDPAPRPPAPTAPPPPPIVVPAMPPLIAGLEKFDLRQIPPSAPRDGAGEAEMGSGRDSAAAYGPGAGPGGARLYKAEWYREPTQAELATYLPQRRVVGFGLIACQTMPRYRVDNCRILQSDPPGSGLAGAVKAAAWQFLVRPPQIDGKPMIGAWVQIRIEFSEAGVDVR